MLFLYIIVGLILLFVILSLILPKQYFIEKSINMQANVQTVFNNVANLEMYKNWNPWQQSDLAAMHTIVGIPKTIGHKYSWKGKKVGEGSLTIKHLIENKSVSFDLEFIKPWTAKADDSWLFEPISESSCKVTWSNKGDLPTPVARLMGPIIKAQLSKQFVQGLNNLKKLSKG